MTSQSAISPALIDEISASLILTARQVKQAVKLLQEGNSLPFIARYRKEATQGLTEVQLRKIDDARVRYTELQNRIRTVLKSLEDQGHLTDLLREQVLSCSSRQQLEEIYLPFRPKRRTRASVAREKGLQPLADILLAQKSLSTSRNALLNQFVSSDRVVPDATAAVDGACDIVAETWADDTSLRKWMCERANRGRFVSRVRRGKKEAGQSFESYFDHSESVSRLASHRFLAMKRGEAEGILRLTVEPDEDYVMPRLERRLLQNPTFEFIAELKRTIGDCYKRLLQPAAESFVMQELKAKADESAIEVFARNVRELLLAPPAGQHVTIGMDPGFRTGCKIAVVDGTGQFLDHRTIFPTPPKSDTEGATEILVDLIQRHKPKFIAIGNGTASRETDAFVADVLRQYDLQVTKVTVSEAGASVYSASERAVAEYPDLDVTVRGAISIAHRLQDPLAELVKIDPKAVGVGQYQHDVNQTRLQAALDREVQSSVSAVGVDANLASAALLSYVPGIGPKLAENIVSYRDSHGSFGLRRDLLKVPSLGEKSFEQAAGFLRIRNGAEPLDNSAVHPEQYHTVEKMARSLQTSTASLIGNLGLLDQLSVKSFTCDSAGDLTIADILNELKRPGRDPRHEFKAVEFDANVHRIGDLKPGMKLQGVVTNVTHFGAFVDIGVHQDGLIHVSQLADHFVTDPSEVVRAGDIVQVTVLEVDESRKRISLSRKTAG